MNHALIRIGAGLGALRERALVAAEKIGKVEVDHGKTGGSTPDAAEAIRKGKVASKPASKPASKAVRKPAAKATASNGKSATAKAAKPAARRKAAAAK